VSAAVVTLAPGPTLGVAAEAFLARRDLDADTLRSYGQTLRRLRRDLGDHTALQEVTAELVAAVVDQAWAHAAARTVNRHRAALRSFTTWAAGRGWLTIDLAALVERRPQIQDRTRAIDRPTIAALWDRRDIGLREKTLWRLLYESAARSGSVLALDIDDLDLDNKRGRTTAKGGVIRWVQWQSGTARLLPRLIAGRPSGPLFLSARRPAPARTPAAGDQCPHTGRARLSYERAEHLFKQATTRHDPARRGYTLHQLRHSRLTHLGEDGWSAPMLMALSGHENLRTLGTYVQISPDAVAAALAAQDPNRRHR
jgi:integrase